LDATVAQDLQIVQNSGFMPAVLDNSAVTPDDFEPFTVTAPMDPLLPGGGGCQVTGLYDVVPALFGQGLLVGRRPEHYGDGWAKHSDFSTLSVSTRLVVGRVRDALPRERRLLQCDEQQVGA
jgi:hypothetical protein